MYKQKESKYWIAAYTSSPNHNQPSKKQFKNEPTVDAPGEADSGPYSEAYTQYVFPLWHKVEMCLSGPHTILVYQRSGIDGMLC